MHSNSIEARKRSWCELYDRQTSRRYVFQIAVTDEAPAAPAVLPWPSLRQERIEYSWACYEQHRERIKWLDDDSIPFMNVGTGTEIFAEALGCSVVRPEDNLPFALPLIKSAAEVSRVKVPELSDSSLAYLFDIADELCRRAGDDALLKIVDIQSPMDIAALVWEKSDFMAAIIEEPEAVKELADKAGQLLTAFLDEWFARYGSEFISHCPCYYMPNGITLSEDEVGVVSAKVFDGLFLPELTMLSERYGGIGIHCCADARHQWDGFMKIPGLRLLNLVQPVDVLDEAYPFFAPYLVQYHWGYGTGRTDSCSAYAGLDPLEWLASAPPEARVVFDLSAASRDEAVALAERMRAWAAGGDLRSASSPPRPPDRRSA